MQSITITNYSLYAVAELIEIVHKVANNLKKSHLCNGSILTITSILWYCTISYTMLQTSDIRQTAYT